jgi:ATP-dependent Clp protease protease subunit
MFQYCIDPTAAEPIMLILKQIGNTVDENGNITEYGICGEDFARELLLLDAMGKDRINIWINSVGGNVVDGWSIFSAILKTKAKVDTYNVGVAASTAGWLFLAGRTRYMSDYAIWMGHNPFSEDGGHTEILQRMRTSIATIISERTGLAIQKVYDLMDRTTYFDATDCKQNNLCDIVEETSKPNVKRVSQAKEITDKYKECLSIVNKVLTFNNNKNSNPMAETVKFPVIVNALNVGRSKEDQIHEAASEQMIAESIDAMRNKLLVTESSLKLAENKAKDTSEAYQKMQDKFKAMEEEMNKLKADMEAEDCRNREAAATEMVNDFMDAGKIEKTEIVKNFWVKNALTDFEGTKAQLAALPVNKKADAIVVTGLASTGGAKNIAQKMAEKAKEKGQRK